LSDSQHPYRSSLAGGSPHHRAKNLSHEDKARRYLEGSINHLKTVLVNLKARRKAEDTDLELWRAYSKAEFALFILSISDEEKRWAVQERFDEGTRAVRLLEEAEQLLRDASRASILGSQENLAKIWRAETRMIHVSKTIQKGERVEGS